MRRGRTSWRGADAVDTHQLSDIDAGQSGVIAHRDAPSDESIVEYLLRASVVYNAVSARVVEFIVSAFRRVRYANACVGSIRKQISSVRPIFPCDS